MAQRKKSRQENMLDRILYIIYTATPRRKNLWLSHLRTSYPLPRAREKLTDLCEEVKREHVPLTLLEELVRGVKDVDTGRVMTQAKLRAGYGR